MRVIALIEDPQVIWRILEHRGRWAPEPADAGPARTRARMSVFQCLWPIAEAAKGKAAEGRLKAGQNLAGWPESRLERTQLTLCRFVN